MPYLPTLVRLALALGVGLFVGIERERRRKEAGLRTFAFVALIGAVGGLLGDHFALLALALVGVLVVLLNVETIRTGEGAEITTSAAMIVVAFGGLLAGSGHTFTPTTLGVVTAALLAWKERLAGFSQTLTDAELRSAVLLAILSFVVYPVLPDRTVDPWHLIQPRDAWVTVMLIAALGFVNYVLLKRYGTRGIDFTGFLGGLVNSTVTVTELTNRAVAVPGLRPQVFRGVLLATAAMLLRNVVVLGVLSLPVLSATLLPIALMFACVVAVASRTPSANADGSEGLLSNLQAPFSLIEALRFGLVFLAVHVSATLAQRAFGHVGFYAVSAIGGVVSSASAVASAATLASAASLPTGVAALGALVAVAVSALVNIPLVARISRDGALTRRVATTIGAVVAAGVIASLIQFLVQQNVSTMPPRAP